MRINDTPQLMRIGRKKDPAVTRQFVEFVFSQMGAITPERDASGHVREFMPQSHYRNPRSLSLNKHGAGPFCRFQVRGLPALPGVYIVTVNDEPAYVGKCQDLVERFGPRGYGAIQPRNCYVGGQSTNCKVNNLIFQGAAQNQRLELWFYATEHRSIVEAKIVQALRPPWNDQVPGRHSCQRTH